MKVIEVQGSFGLENLAVAERPEPEPGPGEVKIRMKASSLNFRDFLMVQGLYNPRQPLPIIPCSDGVGEVVEIGEGVSRVKVGDRVAGCFFQGWPSGAPTVEKAVTTLGSPLDGMLAEYRVLNEEGVVHVPGHLSDEQAATLPCAALTAWSALVTYGGRKAGDTILVQGTGGVSMFGLQIGKMIGARVVVTSSSNEKLDRAAQMGADHGINYKETPKWGKAAREWADGLGVDHVIEVGGAGTLQESLQAVRIDTDPIDAALSERFTRLGPTLTSVLCPEYISIPTNKGHIGLRIVEDDRPDPALWIRRRGQFAACLPVRIHSVAP